MQKIRKNNFWSSRWGQRCMSSFDGSATLYEVPFTTSRPLGRDADINRMWQKMLSGKRIHILEGPDGIGKSTLASMFCDYARSNGRFSCVRWINAHTFPDVQFKSFLQEMKGRPEKNVLFVFDDCKDPLKLLKILPSHENCHIVLTTSVPLSQECSSNSTYSFHVSPLDFNFATESVICPLSEDEKASVAKRMYCVPLLTELSFKLLNAKAASLDDIFSAADKAISEEGFSISRCCSSLIELGIAFIDKERGTVTSGRQLVTLATLNFRDLTLPIVNMITDETFCNLSTQVGLLHHKWDSEGFAMQPVIAKILQTRENCCVDAAAVLIKLWPRRMSGRGNAACSNLVWHVVALQESFSYWNEPCCANQIESADRAASYLAIAEGKDLLIASELWLAVHKHDVANKVVSERSLRIARDLGKTLYKIRKFEESEKVLSQALIWSSVINGETSVAHALIVANYAPFLQSSNASLSKIISCSEIIARALESPEEVLSIDERKVQTESLLVLLLCAAQIQVDLGRAVPTSLKEDISKWETALTKWNLK